MRVLRPLAAPLFCLCLLAVSAAAQPQAERGAVTASAASDRVRFSAPNRVARLRLEVLSQSGDLLAELTSKGSVLDWTLADAQGNRVADGTYLCVVTVKDVSGRLSQPLTLVEMSGGVASARPASAADLTPRQAEAVGPVESEGAAVVGPEEQPAASLLAHDGTDGQLVTTSGDLSFRGGDFFTGRDKELMRLTRDGSLEVTGSLLARGGIRFADGTVLESARGFGREGGKGEKGGSSVGAQSAGDDTVSPSATVGRLAKFSSVGGALADSNIFEDAAGNIGIGTTTPGGVFDVRRTSSSDILQRLWNSGTGGAKLRYVAATGATSQLQLTDGDGWLMSIAGNRAAGMQFRVRHESQANTEAALDQSARMTILSSGNVGIGTTAPAQRLDVVGNVRASGVVNAAQYHIAGERAFAVTGNSSFPTSNTFAGILAGQINTSGGNSFFGKGAGANNNSFGNSFFGMAAGDVSRSGEFNSFFGYSAGRGLGPASGALNSFFGAQAGEEMTSGSSNSFLGYKAGILNSTGSFNVFVGALAGSTNTAGSNNTAIGYNVGVGDGLSYATAIGSGATAVASNSISLGRASGADTVRVFGLGAEGTTPLCRNSNNEISTCVAPNTQLPAAGDGGGQLTAPLADTVREQQQQIERQRREIEELKRAVKTLSARRK